MSVKQVEKDEFLYQKGDPQKCFYFVLRGKLELVVDHIEGGFKFSKNVDENEYFGFRLDSNDKRMDYARGAAPKTEIIEIDKDQYDMVIKKTILSSGEKKIEFLMRYVPKLRLVSRSMIEEFEVFFIKEVVD